MKLEVSFGPGNLKIEELGGGKKKKRRPTSLERLLYIPLESEVELSHVETQIRKERASFFSHLATWGGVSAFLAAINVLTFSREEGLAGLWAIWPTLGWGIGVASHAARVLLAHPRALAVHHQVFARQATGRPEAAATLRDSGMLRAEITKLTEGVRLQVKALQPPRIDLEATLDLAERESEALLSELSRLEAAVATTRAGAASQDRIDAITAERDRVQLALESFRVTLGNLEVDALLAAGSAAPSGFSFESLKTEGELLHAAVEGAREARETLFGRRA